MTEPQNFYNDGFGWICRKCARELPEKGENAAHSRLLREGEAESKIPRFSNPALARWADDARTTLVCPRCGKSETVKSEK